MAFLFFTLTACTAKKNASSPVVPVTPSQTPVSPVVPVTPSQTPVSPVPPTTTSVPSPTATTAVSTGSGYSLSDVALHKTTSDCWAIIDGMVYDITSYVESAQHPGGSNISQCCGVDCSKAFNIIRKHSSGLTDNVLKQYYLGAAVK